jgi:hypothetical protein
MTPGLIILGGLWAIAAAGQAIRGVAEAMGGNR